jgi:hypothetical protein
MAIITIHRSNFARSIANSMSPAKRIERNAIRFVMRVQVREIHGTGILLNVLVLFRILPVSFIVRYCGQPLPRAAIRNY